MLANPSKQNIKLHTTPLYKAHLSSLASSSYFFFFLKVWRIIYFLDEPKLIVYSSFDIFSLLIPNWNNLPKMNVRELSWSVPENKED